MHYALYGNELSSDDHFIQQLITGIPPRAMEVLKGKRGLVFSDAILKRFVEDDYRHGQSKLMDSEARSLRTFSSGERRKVLLEYILKQDPDFIILDDPFDYLDLDSIADLKKRLIEISAEVSIVQIFKRKEDMLPFIDQVLKMEKGQIESSSDTLSFLASTENKQPSKTINIPKALIEFEAIPDSLVSMEEVSVRYENRPILNKINWEIKKGEFWKLSGPNGSGKSTLLSMIYGNNPKAYGQKLYLFGQRKGSGESVWDIKKKIGYFSPALTELFNRRNTVLEMLVSGLVDTVGLYQKPNKLQLNLAKQWLETLQLEEQEHKVFIDLPLLQQRMLLIARAMIKHPPLLILDEPSTSLDDKSVALLTHFINSIATHSASSIVYVSHRKEKGLKPDHTLKLIPTENGSVGEIQKSYSILDIVE